MHLESVTVTLWILFVLSLGLAVLGLVRRSARAVFLAALPAGVFAFFFFWDPHGRLFFVWLLALLTAALSLRWPGAVAGVALAGGRYKRVRWRRFDLVGRAFRLRRSLYRG